jgi:hypothetical protein
MHEAGPLTHLALGALATWRISHLIAQEDGPGGLLARLRARLEHGPMAGLADCFDCVSVWVGVPVAVAVVRRRSEPVLTALALSGAACLLRRAVDPPPLIVPLDDSDESEV